MKQLSRFSFLLSVMLETKAIATCNTPVNNDQQARPKLMKHCLLIVAMLVSFSTYAQVNVTGGTVAAGLYTSLNDALTAVNADIATGPISIIITGPHAETTPPKGLTVGSATLNPTLSATNTLSITSTGGTVTLNAGVGTITDDGIDSIRRIPDGMLKLVGADHVTIDGLTFTDGNSSAPATMEYGIGLFKRTTSDGCNNNLIQHCTFNMKFKESNYSGFSAAITVINSAGASFHFNDNTNAIPTNGGTLATNGTNSGNKFYSNTIIGGNAGIYLSGYILSYIANPPILDPASFLGDLGNDIGGNSTGTGNTILNFGGNTAALDVSGISTFEQYNLNISYNTINNNNGSWVANNRGIYGILSSSIIHATQNLLKTIINNNTISVQSAGAAFGGASVGIQGEAYNDSISINNNIVNLGLLGGFGSTSGIIARNGIINISGNAIGQIPGVALKGGSSTSHYFIFVYSPLDVMINNNTISNINCSSSGGRLRGIYSVSKNRIITGNTIEGLSWTNGFSNVSRNIDGIFCTPFDGVNIISNATVTNNIIRNLSTPSTGIIAGINEGITGGNKIYQNNQIYNFFTTAGGEGGATIIGVNVPVSSTSSHDISGNQIYSLNSTEPFVGTLASVAGISVLSGTTNAIYNNRICDLSSTSTDPTVSGIEIFGGTTNTIYNNRIGDLRAPVANTFNPINGIKVSGTTAAKVYYNTIHLNAASTGAIFGSSGILFTGSVPIPSLDLRNNIIVNTSTPNSTGRTVALRRSTGSANIIPSNYLATSNNNLLYAGTPGTGRHLYAEGTGATVTNPHQLLSTYKTFMSTRDQASVTGDPVFLSTTCGDASYLKINPAVPTPAIGGAVNITGISLDFENDVRQGNPGYTGAGTAPDMGADETNSGQAVFCSGTPVVTSITGAASVCSGTGTTLSLSAGEYGITYAWFSGTTAGGPYPTALGTSPTMATGNLTVPTYYICVTTCTSSGLSYTTVEKTVLINALPAVAVNPASASFCSPGGTPVALTASGANTYTWLPATGLSATTGAIVSSSLASSTTYTVTGTDGNGCVNTATAAVNVLANPQSVTATATPALICSGNTSTLSVTALIPSTAKAYTFNGSGTGSLDPMTGAVTVVGTKTDDAPMNTSNGANSTAGASLPIGFNFPFEGVNYTHFAASPDGWIRLGTTTVAASAQFSNSISSATNVPKISPYWTDMATGTTGNVQTLITGIAPNRIFKVQWFVTIPRNTTGAANSTFQAWLYEGSGLIEFRYGTMGTASATTSGLTGVTSTNFNSITFSSNSASNTVANNSNNVSPVNGKLYSFSPPGGLSYSWTPSGDVVSPGAQTTLTNPLTATTNYQVVVSNGSCSAAPVPVTVIVSSSSSVADITGQPAISAKCAGQTATFTVTATGPSLTYQWYKNSIGNPLNTVANPSAATAILSLSNVTAADAADYFVGITASCGVQVLSDVAALTVTTALAGINVSPSATICSGQTVTLTENGGYATSWNWAPGGETTQQVSVSPSTTTSYTVTATVNGCSATASQTITVNPVPTALSITPASAAICPGGSVGLSATGGMTNLAGTFNAVSGNIALAIPDFSATGISHAIAVSAVPAGAAIDSVIVTLNITHAYDADVEVNLEAPNGQIINLLADRGSSGANFTNTRISSDITRTSLSSGTAPFTGTFRADATAQATLIGSPAVTTQTFSNLFSTINGNWIIRAYDDEAPDAGTLNNWSIKIAYSGLAQGTITWLPTTGLDVATGSSVMASPAATTTYTATATNSFGCISSNAAAVSITTYMITVSTGANGSISPVTGAVNCGDNATYSITADPGYSISDVVVDGSSQGAIGTYTFTNVTANHTVSATFVNNVSYSITASAGTNGSVTPSGVTNVSPGGSQTYIITPAPCYSIADVLVNGVSQGAITTYTFTNVSTNETISASFALNPALPTPGPLNGPSNVCPYINTPTQLTYSVPPIQGAVSYTWVVPPTVTLVSGQGTNSIMVTIGAGFIANANKQIRVTALSPCGDSPLGLFYLLAQLPNTPNPIAASSLDVCPIIGTPNSISFTIPKVTAATSYIWASQLGTTSISHTNGLGVNDTTVTVTFTGGFSSSAITVQAVNDCGTSGTRSLTIAIANPSTPGLINGPSSTCEYQLPGGNNAIYSVAASAGVTYTWTVPSGVGIFTGQGTNSISFKYPAGFTTGTISVTATNGCGTSVARTKNISTLYPATPSPIDVIQLQSCPNRIFSYTLASVPSNAQSLQWTVPAGAFIINGQGTISILVAYPNTSINGTIDVTAVSNCRNSSTRTSKVKLPVCPPAFTKSNTEVPDNGFKMESMPDISSNPFSVELFPNPSSTLFNLKIESPIKEPVEIKVMDIQGRCLKMMTVSPLETIRLGAFFKAGIYILEIKQDKIVTTKRLVKF